MQINKELLLKITGLKLSGIIDKMDNNQFEEYCNDLFDFVKYFHDQEVELKFYFSEKNYIGFSKSLESVRDTLIKIHAIVLVQSIDELFKKIHDHKYQMDETHLTYLLTEISTLSLDIQMAKYNSIAQSEIVLEHFKENKNQKSILAVDDVSLILSTLNMALHGTEYKSIGVRSGKDALKYLKDHTPDLFILDIEMPIMNGYELAKKIRSIGQKAPIIFLTGNTDEECFYKAVEAGASDFIVKPVNNKQVLEKIKKYLDK